MKTTTKALLGVAALAASPGAYANVTSTPFDSPPPSGATVVTFDSKLPSGFSLTGGTIQQGSNGLGAAPAGDSTRYLAAGPSTPATLTADRGYGGVGLYWGSVDLFNSLDVLGTAGEVLRTLTGADVAPAPVDGNQTGAGTNRYVSYTVDPASGQRVQGLRASSRDVAFEFDNVAFFDSQGGPASVPEPGSMALLGLGVGALVAVRRRRRTA